MILPVLFLSLVCTVGKINSLSDARNLSCSQTVVSNEQKNIFPKEANQKITILSKDICLGELLNKISLQINLPLTVSDRDLAAGVKIYVFVENKPAVEVLNTLPRLLGLKSARWEWIIETIDGKKTYRLSRSKASQQYAERVSQEIADRLEKDFDDAISAIDDKQKLKELSDNGNYQAHNASISDVSKNKVKSFGMLPKEVRHSMINRRSDDIDLDLNAVSPALRDAARGSYVPIADAIDRRTGLPLQQPSGSGLTTARFRYDNIRGEVTPTVWLLVGTKNGMQGGAAVGGVDIEKFFRKKIEEDWMDGAQPDLEKEALNVPYLADEPKIQMSSEQKGGNLPDRLRSVSKTSGVAIMARLTMNNLDDPGILVGKKMGAVIRILKDNRLQCKWNNGILLVNDPSWFRYEEQGRYIPYVQRLEFEEKQKSLLGKLWSPADFAWVAGKFSLVQLSILRDELAQQEEHGATVRRMRLDMIIDQYPFWKALSARPTVMEELLSDRGIVPTRLSEEARDWLSTKLSGGVTVDQIRLRLLSREIPEGRLLSLRLILRDGKEVGPGYFCFPADPVLPSATGPLKSP